jgi:small-conductance mechanosensitive channel/CRP-like cAMP-binding protein
VPEHAQAHFLWTFGLLAVIGAAAAAVRTRVARRRLLFSSTLVLLGVVLHLGLPFLPKFSPPANDALDVGQLLVGLESLLVTCGVISAAVTLLFNPWFRERIDGGAPAIMQDTIIVALSVVAAMLIFQSSSFLLGVTGSAIVIGLALQDTLGNAFAGLAIQVERPFRVGHWILAAGHEGRVVEVTWRATKIRTKAGNLITLPNSVVAKEAINNYSEPAIPTRLSFEIGVSYSTPPNETRDAILKAIGRVPRILPSPPPDALLVDFAGSALTYRVRFWIEDFAHDDAIKSEVRIAVYYELNRRHIEIPYPIQVEYQREESPRDSPEIRSRYARDIAAVPVLSPLGAEAIGALAATAVERLYADGEVIVAEGEIGGSMFVVQSGAVVISVGADRRQVAVTETGGYFGEMSLLTGQSRSATVTARGDCRVLEIAAADFRAYVQSHPEVIDLIASSATVRQKELDETRAARGAEAHGERLTLSARMRKFFGLD